MQKGALKTVEWTSCECLPTEEPSSGQFDIYFIFLCSNCILATLSVERMRGGGCRLRTPLHWEFLASLNPAGTLLTSILRTVLPLHPHSLLKMVNLVSF